MLMLPKGTNNKKQMLAEVRRSAGSWGEMISKTGSDIRMFVVNSFGVKEGSNEEPRSPQLTLISMLASGSEYRRR